MRRLYRIMKVPTEKVKLKESNEEANEEFLKVEHDIFAMKPLLNIVLPQVFIHQKYFTSIQEAEKFI